MEEELECTAAVSLYGLDAIASGLAGALGELSSIKALNEKLEERRLAMAKILEALRSIP